MATYTKETALYDTNAIADDISAAGETASKFLSADSSGIMIYDGTNGAQTPSSVGSTTRNVFIDDDSVDVRLGSNTLATFGERTMIGEEQRSRLVFETNQIYGVTDKNVESFRISGDGVTESLPTIFVYQGTFDNTNYQATDVLKYATLTSGQNITVKYSKFDTTTNTFVLLGTLTYKYGTSASENYYTSNSRKYYIKYDGNKTISVKKDQIETGSGLNRFEVRCTTTVDIESPYYTFGSRNDSSTLGAYSFSMGQNNIASGKSSCVEGWGSTASGVAAHAEGSSTASGKFAHSEGAATNATYEDSHAEGWGSTASGLTSHAQNYGTIAHGLAQTAIGMYNISNGAARTYTSDNHAFIIGNGTSDSARSNALTVDWSGNVNIASGAKYKINGTALSASDVSAVPTTRKVNNKALSADITLSASDVSAVPTTRKVNNKALSADITLTASNVGAVSDVQLNGSSLKSGTVANLVTASLIDIFYPVGSYYETSDTSFDPNTSWGGTWVQELAGQVHVSAGTGYSVSGALTNTSDGGSATHHHTTGDHTLTIAEIPSHSHVIKAEYYNRASGNLQTYGYVRQGGANSGTSETTGGGGAHNHGNTGDTSTMQPYIVVNRWHRTA